MGERPKKAYIVTVKGAAAKECIVHANSVAHAAEIMRGDREEIEVIDTDYWETGVSRPRRSPQEDDA